jgi:nitrate/nitrite transporter NarK
VRLVVRPVRNTYLGTPSSKSIESLRPLVMAQSLQSPRAQKLFWYSAWAVVCMGLFMALMLTPLFDRITAIPSGAAILRVIGGVIGVFGTIGAIIIWVAMLLFCFTESSASIAAKIAWTLLFLVAACFGSTAYYFAVYRKQAREQVASA